MEEVVGENLTSEKSSVGEAYFLFKHRNSIICIANDTNQSMLIWTGLLAHTIVLNVRQRQIRNLTMLLAMQGKDTRGNYWGERTS